MTRRARSRTVEKATKISPLRVMGDRARPREAEAALAAGAARAAPAAAPEAGFPAATLAWAGGACREVTAHVQQVYGGIGFALEGGIHRYYRRAKSAAGMGGRAAAGGASALAELRPLRTAGERSSQIRSNGQLVPGWTSL